jgi:Putative transposase DNA-binding domain
VKYSRLTIAVSPQYTSVDCFNCGKRIKKSLSVRTHVCECGYCEDRDINAALNILKKATTGHVGSWSEQLDRNAWGESTSTLIGVILSEQVGSMLAKPSRRVPRILALVGRGVSTVDKSITLCWSKF